MRNANKQYNDYELIYMIEDESPEAMEIIINKYSPLIYTRLKKFHIKVNYIDDYYQEGLLVLLQAIKKYNLESPMSFTNFFDLMLQRKIIDLLRKNKRYFEDNLLKEDVDIVVRYESENKIIIEEQINLLMNKLSDLERQIFDLKYNKNMKAREIATSLKIDLKKVYAAGDRIKSKAMHLKQYYSIFLDNLHYFLYNV